MHITGTNMKMIQVHRKLIVNTVTANAVHMNVYVADLYPIRSSKC